jgi:hypothetical protein
MEVFGIFMGGTAVLWLGRIAYFGSRGLYQSYLDFKAQRQLKSD